MGGEKATHEAIGWLFLLDQPWLLSSLFLFSSLWSETRPRTFIHGARKGGHRLQVGFFSPVGFTLEIGKPSLIWP